MERVDYDSLIIADLLRFHADGSLDLNPWYQRRSVWSDPQRAYLINTIFERNAGTEHVHQTMSNMRGA